jgi:hypothetical protein
MTAMSDPEFRHRVGTGKREILLEKARAATTPAITFQDFVNVVSFFVQLNSFLCASYDKGVDFLCVCLFALYCAPHSYRRFDQVDLDKNNSMEGVIEVKLVQLTQLFADRRGEHKDSSMGIFGRWGWHPVENFN